MEQERLKSSHPARIRRLDALREAIRNGTYVVNPEAIAAAIIALAVKAPTQRAN